LINNALIIFWWDLVFWCFGGKKKEKKVPPNLKNSKLHQINILAISIAQQLSIS